MATKMPVFRWERINWSFSHLFDFLLTNGVQDQLQMRIQAYGRGVRSLSLYRKERAEIIDCHIEVKDIGNVTGCSDPKEAGTTEKKSKGGRL